MNGMLGSVKSAALNTMHYDVIINRESGSGFFKEKDPQDMLRAIFEKRGHSIDLQILAPEEINAAIDVKISSPAEILIIGGGDGTINATAGKLLHSKKILGVLPLGTFNLEARDLRLSLDPLVAAEQLLIAETAEIDVLRVGEHCCLCATVLGFYPTLAKNRESFHGKAWWNKSARIVYEISTIATHSPALVLTLSTDERKITRKTRLAAFSPGQFQDSIGIIPERDSLNSGKLNAYISNHLSRVDLLKASLKYLTGTLFNPQNLTLVETNELLIETNHNKPIAAMIDGEIVTLELPCQLKIEPRALKVLKYGEPSF